MKRNLPKYFVLFLIFVLAVVVLNRLFSGGEAGSTFVTKSSQCLTVKENIQPGDFLEPKDLLWRNCQSVESQNLARDYIWRDTETAEVVGSVARSPLVKGEFVLAREIIRPGDSEFLAAVLKPGHRATAIRVDDVTGGAGLIRPGNLVDVIVSGKFNLGASRYGEIPTAKTLLRGARVLAVNRDVFLQESNRAERTESSSRDNKGTVTLEVAPKEVELLSVAKTMGVLSLALCSLDDSGVLGDPSLIGPTLATEIVSPQADGSPQPIKERQVVTLFGTGQAKHGGS
ncbi:MAG: Flp pilus assembly protein CpaB [Deltaproteobacteria bacterium]|jgi:pilus assembly protein CpaB|nr:Flp pilus assembly protein CpaB [Deltaproteobacteria bacterium]